jgi:AraC-like DNA-binding protein
MNPLLDALRSFRVVGGIFLDWKFTAPWCVATSPCKPGSIGSGSTPPSHVIAYHYVKNGRLRLQLRNRKEICVEAGEIVIFPTNKGHKLGSNLRLTAVNARELLRSATKGDVPRIEHGGGGECTEVMCGFLGVDSLNDPLVAMLPDVLKLDIRRSQSSDWIESSLRFAALETAARRASSHAILAQLAECLFIEAVREYLESLPDQRQGWLAGMSDPVVGRALNLLHRQKEHPWTVDELAEKVGRSRSSFADRFTRIMGEPPIRYIAKLRLRLAAQKLRTSHDSIAQVGIQAGYQSEAAFSRAFKRELGASPSVWRVQSQDGAADDSSVSGPHRPRTTQLNGKRSLTPSRGSSPRQ